MENTENAGNNSAPQNTDNSVHWNRTRNLMLTTLGIWVLFSYVVHWFAAELNAATFIGFPLGFYMASQGSLIAFVVLLFWFAHKQNKIDIDCGVQELDDDSSSS